MDRRTGWTRFAPLMVGMLVLLVFGWTSVASARRGGERADRESWRGERADREAEGEAREPQRAEKKAAGERLRGTASSVIGPEGGTLWVSYRGGRGGKDDVEVQFIVPKNALTEPQDISVTLTVDTEDLSYIMVTFTPSGLNFKLPAKLKIKLGKDLIEGIGYESMVGLHRSKRSDDDGELVEVVPLIIQPGDIYTEVQMNVPGFSRYSLGPGD